MQFTDIQMEMARQVHLQKPSAFVPGEDVGFQPVGQDTLAVVLPKRGERVDVRYDAGPDTYTTTRMLRRAGIWIAQEPVSDIYCDQLGELIFGSEAEPLNEPLVRIFFEDDDGQMREVI